MRLALIIGGGFLLWMIFRERLTEQGGTDIEGFHVPTTVDSGKVRKVIGSTRTTLSAFLDPTLTREEREREAAATIGISI